MINKNGQEIKDVTNEILIYLRKGDLYKALEFTQELSIIAMALLEKDHLDKAEVEILDRVLRIGNIYYNDTDLCTMPIEDGLYDILLEKYKQYNPNGFQVGAEVLSFNNTKNNNDYGNSEKYQAVEFVDKEYLDNMIFAEDIIYPDLGISYESFKQPAIMFDNGLITKRKHNTQHEHPELVGTLDKCKFVLTKDAIDRGVEKDPKVKILERDFFQEHIKAGIIDPNKSYDMVLELKYDGISIEADVTNVVESARSRGDTGIGTAADMTPILEGYPFPSIPPGMRASVGVKFEAIMTLFDLQRFNTARGKNYKNCRSAIVGLFGAGDAYLYRDYITLIPLQLDPEILGGEDDRSTEICVLNELFATKGQPLRYVVISGNYMQLLFQIKKFQDEAEYSRQFLPFMYDGIVVSYLDKNIRKILGRKNFINKYSMAVKFNPLKKQTIFREYKFTVGQDGSITPMIYYDPVEFYGTIHPKSSGHSYARFNTLRLRKGDIIDVEYMNDVMPYVSKPMNDHNYNNPNPLEEFPSICPECGKEIIISSSGKSAKCINSDCIGRKQARMVNMLSKLNLKDFGEAAIGILNRYHLSDIIDLSYDELIGMGFGPTESQNFMDIMNNLKSNNIYDYQIFGALGFTNVAEKTWMLIFNKFNINDILNMYTSDSDNLKNNLVAIKGIGPVTAETIVNEIDYFYPDIVYICTNLTNIVTSKGLKLGKQIRCTGFRNSELMEQLRSLGFDADDNAGVTNSTDILLVPYEGYASGNKVAKASKVPNIQIISIDDFVSDMDRYLY